MAHYVVSDIHGEADRFYAMLEKIRFSADDTLYILGDVMIQKQFKERYILHCFQLQGITSKC